MKPSALMGILILLVLAAGCAQNAQTAQKNQPVQQSTAAQQTPAVAQSDLPMKVTVSIYSAEFRPKEVTIAKGGIVEWINKDTKDHAVSGDTFPMPTSASPKTSGRLQPGEGWEKKFDETGFFPYVDMYDNSFSGKVIVK